MKTTIFSLAALAAAGGAHAQDSEVSVSGGVSFLTDYSFRGVSQTDTGPAVQGSLEAAYDVSGETQLYASLWGSNLDFADADIELDFTAGLRQALGGGTLDVRGIYYAYPGADGELNYDYAEAAATYLKAFGDFELSGSAYYSPEFFGDSGDALHLNAGAGYALTETVRLNASLGHQWIEDNAAFGLPDYLDWSLGASTRWQGLDFGLSLIGTDLDGAECGSDLCDARLVFSVGASF